MAFFFLLIDFLCIFLYNNSTYSKENIFMKFNPAEFTVSLSRTSQNIVHMQVTDEKSGLIVLKLDMTLEQYALISTGLTHDNINGQVLNTQQLVNIGKQRETKQITITDQESTHDKLKQAEIVLEHFQEHYQHDGWLISNDGTERQQPTDYHTYSIFRYI